MASKGRVFTQEEVNTILSRAVERQNPAAGGLTYAELVDTARQAGIDPSAINEAVEDLAARGAVANEDDEVSRELARRKWRAVRAFAIHFTVFAMFSVLISFLNWRDWHDGGELFAPIPILAWGIGVAAHFTSMLFSTVFPNPDRIDRVRRELRRREERDQKRAQRGTKKEKRSVANEELKESAKELGVAVQRGMATVLSDVAKSIHEEVERAKQGGRPARGGEGGTRVGGPRARVGEAEEEEGTLTTTGGRRGGGGGGRGRGSGSGSGAGSGSDSDSDSGSDSGSGSGSDSDSDSGFGFGDRVRALPPRCSPSRAERVKHRRHAIEDLLSCRDVLGGHVSPRDRDTQCGAHLGVGPSGCREPRKAMPAVAPVPFGQVQRHGAEGSSKLLSQISIAAPDLRDDGLENSNRVNRQLESVKS